MTHAAPSSFYSKGNCSSRDSRLEKICSTTTSIARANGISAATASHSRSSAVKLPQRNISPGSLRSRENVIVSSQELRQMFESIKEVGNLVKRQNNKIETMAGHLETSRKDMVELKEQVKLTLERHEAEKENHSHYGPVPKEVKDDVRLLHNQQDAENQFDGSQGVDSIHNSSVRAFILEELSKENNGHSKSSIHRAIKRYYETKRQQFLDNTPDRKEAAKRKQKEKKLTSRRRRLFVSRMKVANEEDKQKLRQLGSNAMSDEEDGDGDQQGLWVVRSPSWRSSTFKDFIKKLQGRLDQRNQSSSSHPKNTRLQGPHSTRKPPPHLPNWATAASVKESQRIIGSCASNQSNCQTKRTNQQHPSVATKLARLARGHDIDSDYDGNENDHNMDTIGFSRRKINFNQELRSESEDE